MYVLAIEPWLPSQGIWTFTCILRSLRQTVWLCAYRERDSEDIRGELCGRRLQGIKEKTNYSLHATGATALFNASVPEKLIWDVIGHHSSIRTICMYQCPSLNQQQSVSWVLMQGEAFWEEDFSNPTAVIVWPMKSFPLSIETWSVLMLDCFFRFWTQ